MEPAGPNVGAHFCVWGQIRHSMFIVLFLKTIIFGVKKGSTKWPSRVISNFFVFCWNSNQFVEEPARTKFGVHFCVWGQIRVNMFYVLFLKNVIFGVRKGSAKWHSNCCKMREISNFIVFCWKFTYFHNFKTNSK